MTSLGIVGTALRGKNTEFDNLCIKETYYNMLVSGGAAFSDHIAVDLFYDYLSKSVKKTNLQLLIYYPTKLFDLTSKIGKTLVYYHKYFSKLVYQDENATIKDIVYLVNSYPNQVSLSEESVSSGYSGFFSRNKKIANNSDYLLVFSYFDANGNCLTSGTASTIKAFLSNNTEDKIIKVDIRELK